MAGIENENRARLALKVAVTGAVALACYVQLHPSAIREMLAAPALAQELHLGGTLSAYFLERRRHLAELAVLLLGGCIYWRQRRQIPDRTPVWLAGLTSLVLFLLHPTPAYVVFAMPFLLWPTLEAYGRTEHLRAIPALLFLFLLAGYAYLYRTNLHEGFTDGDFSRVRASVDGSAGQLHLASDQVRVAGDYSLAVCASAALPRDRQPGLGSACGPLPLLRWTAREERPERDDLDVVPAAPRAGPGA